MKSGHRPPTHSTGTADRLPSGPATGAAVVVAGVKRISSRVLFSDENEIEIEHNGLLYRLRQTSLGKLILTK